eukprot:2402613-Amphidinium_carterae.1
MSASASASICRLNALFPRDRWPEQFSISSPDCIPVAEPFVLQQRNNNVMPHFVGQHMDFQTGVTGQKELQAGVTSQKGVSVGAET